MCTIILLCNVFLYPFPAGTLVALRQMEVDEPVLLPRLPRVAVCGGTHGNELSGVYLVRELLKEGQDKKTDDEGPLPVQMLLSNPRAIQQCRRYIDADLNRCFSLATLK